jgi:chromatin segregation and condensation protein Rec8/ScpA/Scc1 (kleisin family)
VAKNQKTDGGLDDVRQSLIEKLQEVDEQLEPYQELVEKHERLAGALAALDGGNTIKKRVKWEQVAEYVAEHPGSQPAEIAAALEVPAPNAQSHLLRNENTVFEKRKDGWHAIDGWETHRRDRARGRE